MLFEISFCYGVEDRHFWSNTTTQLWDLDYSHSLHFVDIPPGYIRHYNKIGHDTLSVFREVIIYRWPSVDHPEEKIKIPVHSTINIRQENLSACRCSESCGWGNRSPTFCSLNTETPMNFCSIWSYINADHRDLSHRPWDLGSQMT